MEKYMDCVKVFHEHGIVEYRSKMAELLEVSPNYPSFCSPLLICPLSLINPKADQGLHHDYSLVPLNPEMNQVVIHQQAENVITPTAATDFTLSFFPFSPSTFKIRSHLHPKFAILSHGHFLRLVTPEDKLEPHMIPHATLVEQALQLYNFWVTAADGEDPSFRATLPPRKTKVAKMQEEDKSYSGRLPAVGTSGGVSTRSTSILSAGLGSVASGYTAHRRLPANELDADGDTEAPNSSFRASGTTYLDPKKPSAGDMEDIEMPPSPTRDRSVAGGSTRSHATAASKRFRHCY